MRLLSLSSIAQELASLTLLCGLYAVLFLVKPPPPDAAQAFAIARIGLAITIIPIFVAASLKSAWPALLSWAVSVGFILFDRPWGAAIAVLCAMVSTSLVVAMSHQSVQVNFPPEPRYRGQAN